MSDRRHPRRFTLPLLRHRLPELIDREMHFHIEERVQGLMANGMARDEAVAEVERRFGSYEHYRDATRAVDEEALGRRHRIDLLDAARRGGAAALRTVRRAPGFSAILVGTLALGIGATTAIYSALDRIALRPLPYPDADALVAVKHRIVRPLEGTGYWGLSSAGYFQLQREPRAFASLGAFSTTAVTLLGDAEATRVQVATTTASLYPTLGLRTILGRPITEADDQPGAEQVVVLSYETWQARFGGDSGIVGRTITLGSSPVPVVGVMAPGTTLPPIDLGMGQRLGLAMVRVEMWAALRLDPSQRPVNMHWLQAVGRLRPGMTREAALAEVTSQVARFGELFPSAYPPSFLSDYGFAAAVTPLRDDLLGSTRRVLWMLLGAVLLVFLSAAGNAGNLLAARAEGTRREVAIRTALGAGSLHLAIEQVTEVLVLCGVAAVIGLGVAGLGLQALVAAAPDGLPRMDEVALSWRSWLVALSLATVSGVALGLLPRLRSTRTFDALREGSKGSMPSLARRRIRAGLVVMQVTLAVVLLAACGVLVRSVLRLHGVRPGFDPQGAIAVDVALPSSAYKSYDAVARFHRLAGEQLAAIPGVTQVGAGSDVPLDGMGGCAVLFAEGSVLDPRAEPPCVASALAGPGYFDALGIEVRGHAPTWQNLDGNTGAVVVTRALAERLWPGQDPIGRGVRPNGSQPPYFRISGVIEELRGAGLERPPMEAVFYPLVPTPGTELWGPGSIRSMSVIVRTSLADPLQLLPAIRQAVTAMDGRVPVVNTRTMEDVVRRSMARMRFITILLGVSAALALALSATGLFGVISYLVTQRRPEIGVRLALGARSSQVAGLVMRESLVWTAAGVAVGLLIALAVNRLLAGMLFETSSTDVLTFVLVPVLLLGIAALASALPARRASSVSPAEVLRQD